MNLEDLIQERITEIRKECSDSQEKLNEFLRSEQSLINDLRKKLKFYEEFCSQYRKNHNLQPFSWDRETPDRVRSAFDSKNLRSNVPRTVAQRLASQAKLEAAFKNQIEYKIKPEYQGANHPLEQNQIIRNPK